jgi:hypothetical protein
MYVPVLPGDRQLGDPFRVGGLEGDGLEEVGEGSGIGASVVDDGLSPGSKNPPSRFINIRPSSSYSNCSLFSHSRMGLGDRGRSSGRIMATGSNRFPKENETKGD